MSIHRVCVILLSSLSLAGCSSWAASTGPIPIFNPGPGVFGGTHVSYDSTIKPGHLYRTATPGPLQFGSQLSAFCTDDFEYISVQVEPDENKQSYKDELSGKISASASGIQWVKALFDISASGEAAVTADFKEVNSDNAKNLSEIEKRLGAKCKRAIAARRAEGYQVVLIQRAYRAKEVDLTASWKAGAKASVGNLKFVTVGPNGEIEGGRKQNRKFYNTVVEIVPYTGE